LKRAGHARAREDVRGLAREVDAADEEPARRGRDQAGERVEEGGLAGAVRPDDAHQGSVFDLEIDTVDRGEAAEADDDAARRQRGRRHRAAARSSRARSRQRPARP
jgi:hypothetical protein